MSGKYTCWIQLQEFFYGVLKRLARFMKLWSTSSDYIYSLAALGLSVLLLSSMCQFHVFYHEGCSPNLTPRLTLQGFTAFCFEGKNIPIEYNILLTKINVVPWGKYPHKGLCPHKSKYHYRGKVSPQGVKVFTSTNLTEGNWWVIIKCLNYTHITDILNILGIILSKTLM